MNVIMEWGEEKIPPQQQQLASSKKFWEVSWSLL
jgi:hypothetical protein